MSTVPTTRVTTCHGCGYHFLIPTSRYGDTVQCTECHAFFDSDLGAPTDVLLPPGVPAAPHPDLNTAGPFLTAPHYCHPCLLEAEQAGAPTDLRVRADIHDANGLRQHTTVHQACGRKVSLYAAVYWCPRCLGRRTKLESPRWQWGQETTCPTCRGKFTVPDDHLLRFVEPDQQSMVFRCDSCREELTVNVVHAGRPAVCLYCYHVVEVPRAGREDRNRRYHHSAGAQALTTSRNRCPTCSLALPLRAARCPYCSPALHP